MSDEQAEKPEKAEKAKKAEKPAKAEKAKKAEKPGKDKKGKKGDNARSEPADGKIALNRHPRALAAIARLRSTAALGSAAFVVFLSHTAAVPLDDCILRGLTAGVVGYFVGWYVGVTVWRQLIRAEIRIAIERHATASGEAEA